MNPDNLPDSREQELLSAAVDVPLELPTGKPPANTFFGKTLDLIGPYLLWVAVVVAGVTFVIGAVGGESVAWVSNFYVATVILLVLYIPYQFRKNRREEIASATRRMQEQEVARAAVVRMILEEKHKNEENKK